MHINNGAPGSTHVWTRPVAPWKPPSAATLQKQEQAANLRRLVDEIGGNLRPSSGLTGKQRLENQALRLGEKLGTARGDLI